MQPSQGALRIRSHRRNSGLLTLLALTYRATKDETSSAYKNRIYRSIPIVVALVFTACGGGGGAESTLLPTEPPASPTTAPSGQPQPSPSPTGAPTPEPQPTETGKPIPIPTQAPSAAPVPTPVPTFSPSPTPDTQPTPEVTPTGTPIDPVVEAGKAEYEAMCVGCHGIDGVQNTNGSSALYLLNPSRASYGHSSQPAVMQSLEDYIEDWMPLGAGVCTGACATEVAAYIRSWVGEPEPEPTANPQPTPTSIPSPVPSTPPTPAPTPTSLPTSMPTPTPLPSTTPSPGGVLPPLIQAGKDRYLETCGTACHGSVGLGGAYQEIISAIGDGDFLVATIERMPWMGDVTRCGANCASEIKTWLEYEHDLKNGTPEPTPTPTSPAEPEEIRYVSYLAVNVGGGDYTGRDGTEYQADFGFSGGGTSNQEGIIVAVPNTEDDGLFFTERWGESEYEFEVPEGYYNVEFGFVELVQTHTAAGARVFDVLIEGEPRLSNVDPVGETGSYHRALIKEAEAIWVGDGALSIEMRAVVFNPTLSFINIKRAENTADKYARLCSNCHGGTNGEGRSELGDALTAGKCSSCGNRTGLINFIDSQMPFQFAHACEGECATEIADYILDNFAGYQGRPDVNLPDFLDKGGDVTACGVPDSGFSTLRRIASVDYARMVHDLLAVEGDFVRGFSSDQLVGNFFINSTRAPEFNQVKQYFEAASQVAEAALMTKSQWMPNCASENETCAEAIIESIGRRAYRRPVSSDERTRLLTVFRSAYLAESFDRGVSTLLQAILSSPQFLYYIEMGEGQGQVRPLTHYELAGRLALFLWRSVPDEELLALAESAQLHDDQILRTQVNRMLDDERAKEVVSLFHEQWMRIQEPHAGTEDYDKQHAALEDFRRTVGALVFDDNAAYSQLFTVDFGFLNDATQSFYEVNGGPVAVGEDGFDRYELNPNYRAGLLTRAPFLRSNHSPTTRGLFLREQVLCGVIPPAPPTVGEPDQSVPGLNPREIFKLHTEDPGCGGCHTLMDPLGFPLDNFDDRGMWREIYGDSFPVDDSGYFLKTDVDGAFSGAQGLQEKLSVSVDVRECYTYQWFQFAVGRTPSTQDTCSLGQANDTAYSEGGTIQDVIRSIVMSDAFRHRRAVSP